MEGQLSSIAQIRAPLRRASYIKIKDLASPFNVDLSLLEVETKKAKENYEYSKDEWRRSEGDNTTLHSDDAHTSVRDKDYEFSPWLQTNNRATPQSRQKPPAEGYNMCVLVGNVDVVVDKFRVDQSRVRLAEVEVGDETGCMSLRARDEQIDLLEKMSKLHNAMVLRNCTVELYKGRHLRLAVTKWGKLSPFPDNIDSTPKPPLKINRNLNLSLADIKVMEKGKHEQSIQHDIHAMSTGMEHVYISTGHNMVQAPNFASYPYYPTQKYAHYEGQRKSSSTKNNFSFQTFSGPVINNNYNSAQTSASQPQQQRYDTRRKNRRKGGNRFEQNNQHDTYTSPYHMQPFFVQQDHRHQMIMQQQMSPSNQMLYIDSNYDVNNNYAFQNTGPNLCEVGTGNLTNEMRSGYLPQQQQQSLTSNDKLNQGVAQVQSYLSRRARIETIQHPSNALNPNAYYVQNFHDVDSLRFVSFANKANAMSALQNKNISYQGPINASELPNEYSYVPAMVYPLQASPSFVENQTPHPIQQQPFKGDSQKPDFPLGRKNIS